MTKNKQKKTMKAWVEMYKQDGSIFQPIYFSRKEALETFQSSNPEWRKKAKIIPATITYYA